MDFYAVKLTEKPQSQFAIYRRDDRILRFDSLVESGSARLVTAKILTECTVLSAVTYHADSDLAVWSSSVRYLHTNYYYERYRLVLQCNSERVAFRGGEIAGESISSFYVCDKYCYLGVQIGAVVNGKKTPLFWHRNVRTMELIGALYVNEFEPSGWSYRWAIELAFMMASRLGVKSYFEQHGKSIEIPSFDYAPDYGDEI